MTDPRRPAYDAVYAYLAATSDLPRDLVTRNAIIWRAVHTALDAMGTPHRQLIAQLEADRARMLGATDAATVEEVRIAQSGLAAGYLHAIARALQIFEGPESRKAYLREHADGRHLTCHDGPTVAETAADDRAHWEDDKYSREGNESADS